MSNDYILELDSSVIRRITVHFRDAGSDRRGKPAHVHGVELLWDLLESPPASVEDMKKSAFDTVAPTCLPLMKRTGAKRYTFAPVGKRQGGQGALG